MIGRLIHRYRRAVPYLLLLPGLLWLFLFFVVPNVPMFLYSLSEGTGIHARLPATARGLGVVELPGVGHPLRRQLPQLHRLRRPGRRSSRVLIGYPLAYAIAFRGGRYKNLLLFLVIAPFFTSFLIRTISWKIILGNNGPFLGIVRDVLGLVPPTSASSARRWPSSPA